MIKPKNNFFITGFFNWYISRILKRHFYSISFNKPDFDPDKAILFIANHFSWWDGFLIHYVNKQYFKKQFHIMVLEDSVRKERFMKYTGAFSVAKNSKQVIESLNYASELLTDPQNMVVIFPQGKLNSNFVDDVVFQKGTSRIAAKAGHNFQYVFSATFVENFKFKKPGANIYLHVLSVDSTSPGDLQNAYQQHYTNSKQQQNTITV